MSLPEATRKAIEKQLAEGGYQHLAQHVIEYARRINAHAIAIQTHENCCEGRECAYRRANRIITAEFEYEVQDLADPNDMGVYRHVEICFGNQCNKRLYVNVCRNFRWIAPI